MGFSLAPSPVHIDLPWREKGHAQEGNEGDNARGLFFRSGHMWLREERSGGGKAQVSETDLMSVQS